MCIAGIRSRGLHLTRSYLVAAAAAAFTRPARGGNGGGGGGGGFLESLRNRAPLYGTRMERGGRVSWGTRRRLGNATTNVCQRSRIRIVYTVTTDRGAITSSAKFSFALPLRSLPRRKAEESSNAARWISAVALAKCWKLVLPSKWEIFDKSSISLRKRVLEFNDQSIYTKCSFFFCFESSPPIIALVKSGENWNCYPNEKFLLGSKSFLSRSWWLIDYVFFLMFRI